MTRHPAPWLRLAAGLLALAFATTACGAAATPAPTATPTPSPTASPTPNPTPSPSVAVDPAAGLAIAAPYTITELDPASAAAIQAAMESSMGAFASVIHVGTRTVDKGGSTVAYVMVIEFPAGTITASMYDTFLLGMTSTGKTTFKSTTISGVKVSTGKLGTSNVGLFHIGDHVLMILAPVAADVIPITEALLTANQ